MAFGAPAGVVGDKVLLIVVPQVLLFHEYVRNTPVLVCRNGVLCCVCDSLLPCIPEAAMSPFFIINSGPGTAGAIKYYFFY